MECSDVVTATLPRRGPGWGCWGYLLLPVCRLPLLLLLALFCKRKQRSVACFFWGDFKRTRQNCVETSPHTHLGVFQKCLVMQTQPVDSVAPVFCSQCNTALCNDQGGSCCLAAAKDAGFNSIAEHDADEAATAAATAAGFGSTAEHEAAATAAGFGSTAEFDVAKAAATADGFDSPAERDEFDGKRGKEDSKYKEFFIAAIAIVLVLECGGGIYLLMQDTVQCRNVLLVLVVGVRSFDMFSDW